MLSGVSEALPYTAVQQLFYLRLLGTVIDALPAIDTSSEVSILFQATKGLPFVSFF